MARPTSDPLARVSGGGSGDELPLLDQGHLSFFSLDNLRRLLGDCGFEVERAAHDRCPARAPGTGLAPGTAALRAPRRPLGWRRRDGRHQRPVGVRGRGAGGRPERGASSPSAPELASVCLSASGGQATRQPAGRRRRSATTSSSGSARRRPHTVPARLLKVWRPPDGRARARPLVWLGSRTYSRRQGTSTDPSDVVSRGAGAVDGRPAVTTSGSPRTSAGRRSPGPCASPSCHTRGSARAAPPPSPPGRVADRSGGGA